MSRESVKVQYRKVLVSKLCISFVLRQIFVDKLVKRGILHSRIPLGRVGWYSVLADGASHALHLIPRKSSAKLAKTFGVYLLHSLAPFGAARYLAKSGCQLPLRWRQHPSSIVASQNEVVCNRAEYSSPEISHNPRTGELQMRGGAEFAPVFTGEYLREKSSIRLGPCRLLQLAITLGNRSRTQSQPVKRETDLREMPLQEEGVVS